MACLLYKISTTRSSVHLSKFSLQKLKKRIYTQKNVLPVALLVTVYHKGKFSTYSQGCH